jgi:hypothetical protein
MSHDLLIHAVVDKTERACILSHRSIDDRNEEEEKEEVVQEEALNQLVISFRESHNSASYPPFARHRTVLRQHRKKRREKSTHLIVLSLSHSLTQVIVVG